MPKLTLLEAQARFRAAMLRRDKQTLRELTAAYRSAYSFIKRDAERLLDKIARAQEAGEHVNQFWLHQEERYRSLLIQIQKRINGFSNGAAGKISEAQADLIAMGGKDALALIAAHFPPEIAASFDLLPARAVENLVGVLSDGSPLADLLGELGPEAQRMISRTLIQGLASGMPIRRIAKGIDNALGGNLTRALNISRTESLRAYRESSRQTYKENSDVVKGWRWTASLSSRTCFPAGTLIETVDGPTPIEHVTIGDRVLTHTGRLQRVIATSCRTTDAHFVEFDAQDQRLTATHEHPILVKRNEVMQWMEAGKLRYGDEVFIGFAPKRSFHGLIDCAVERSSGQSYHAETPSQQDLCFSGISGNSFTMPIGFIYFNDQIPQRQIEINRIPPPWYAIFLNKVRTASFKDHSHVALRFGFACMASVAYDRTKTITGLLSKIWLNSEFDFTGWAFSHYRRAAAYLRTIMSNTARAGIKTFAAPLTNSLRGIGFSALEATEDLPAFAVRYKPSSAVGAFYMLSNRGLTACHGAITTRVPLNGYSVDRPTLFTRQSLIWSRYLSSFCMWMNALICGVTYFRTKPATTPSDPCGRTCKLLATLKADTFYAASESLLHPNLATLASAEGGELLSVPYINPSGSFADRTGSFQAASIPFDRETFHGAIITYIQHRNAADSTVYNLEVENDHSYVANGIIVHNCAMCLAMDGSEHTNDETLDSHPSCKCTMTPLTKSWRDLGIPMDEPPVEFADASTWLREQPIGVQQQILGRSGYTAFRDGKVTLQDFVGTRVHPRWGMTRYVKPMHEMGLQQRHERRAA